MYVLYKNKSIPRTDYNVIMRIHDNKEKMLTNMYAVYYKSLTEQL